MYSLSRIARRLYSSAAEIPKGFWWLKDGKLAAVSKPKVKSDLEYLKNNGVTHLVSLTEKVPDFHGVDLTSVHMPVEGGGMNSIEQANDFYKLVEDVSGTGGVSIVQGPALILNVLIYSDTKRLRDMPLANILQYHELMRLQSSEGEG